MSVVVCIGTYTLFALAFLSYGQRQIALSQSSAAAAALCVNLLVLPRLFARVGESVTCAMGLVLLGVCHPNPNPNPHANPKPTPCHPNPCLPP